MKCEIIYQLLTHHDGNYNEHSQAYLLFKLTHGSILVELSELDLQVFRT
jgi:hypothetical protein